MIHYFRLFSGAKASPFKYATVLNDSFSHNFSKMFINGYSSTTTMKRHSFNGHRRGQPDRLHEPNFSILDFVGAKDDDGGGDELTTGTIRLAKLQSSRHHQQSNTQLLTGRMPFLSPSQQCQSSEGKTYHIPRTCSPQAHLWIFRPCR